MKEDVTEYPYTLRGYMGIQVAFPFLQTIYLRITKISQFLTPPEYKNQAVCLQASERLLPRNNDSSTYPVTSQAERHVKRQVLTIAFNLELLGVEDIFITDAIGITLGKIVERYRRIRL